MAEIRTVFRIGFQRKPGGIMSFCVPHHPEIAAVLVSLRSEIQLRRFDYFSIEQSAGSPPYMSGASIRPRSALRLIRELAEWGANDLLQAHALAEHDPSTSAHMNMIGDEFVRLVKWFRLAPRPFPITSNEVQQAPVETGPDGSITTKLGICYTEDGVKVLAPAAPPGYPFQKLIADRLRERAVETVNDRFRRVICGGVIH